MNVLVIGGSGVISRAVVRQLLEAGHRPTVFNRGRRLEAPAGVTQIIGDRKDYPAFEAEMTGRRFDAVIDVLSYNADDAASLLRAFGGRTGHILVTSTTATYVRPFRRYPVCESNELLLTDPLFPYGFHKSEMERYLQPATEPQADARGTPITIIRPSLTFGEGSANVGVLRQNHHIPARLQAGKPLVGFGDGTAIWSFTFAPDLARGYVQALGRSSTFGKAYHVCSEERVVFDELYHTFARLTGTRADIRHLPAELLKKADPGLFSHLWDEKAFSGLYDCSAFRADVPEWRAEIGLEAGVHSLLDWYARENPPLDPVKTQLEDDLVALWERWAAEIEGLAARKG